MKSFSTSRDKLLPLHVTHHDFQSVPVHCNDNNDLINVSSEVLPHFLQPPDALENSDSQLFQCWSDHICQDAKRLVTCSKSPYNKWVCNYMSYGFLQN